MGNLDNSGQSVLQSTRKLRERIRAVPDYSGGNGSSDEMSDNEMNSPNQESQFRKNRPSNLGEENVTLTAKQKYHKEYQNLNRARLKQCAKDYYAINKDRIREVHKKYRLEHFKFVKDCGKDYCARNKEKIREWKRNYRAENRETLKEKFSQYRAENREIFNERQRKYRAENSERIRQRRREYIIRNIEKCRGYSQAYRDRNREMCREKARLYRSRQRQAKQDKNQRLKEAYNVKKSLALDKMNSHLLSDLGKKSILPMANAATLKETSRSTVKTPVVKKCVVLLEKLNIPESSLKLVELNYLGKSQTPRKPKLPKTIPKKSFATERCSKLAGRLSENRRNCILVESSERGNNVQEIIVESDTTYLQKMFLEVEKMLTV